MLTLICDVIAISIHALLAESDANRCTTVPNFRYFYPRSPCGERLWPGLLARPFFIISIHALLAESDLEEYSAVRVSITISIHALLAESDSGTKTIFAKISDFYPRSPCGERQQDEKRGNQSEHYFYPRSPCGERPLILADAMLYTQFLSTLSLRRATASNHQGRQGQHISIHALLAESDRDCSFRPPPQIISIHALLAESDSKSDTATAFPLSFLSTLSLRRATANQGA